MGRPPWLASPLHRLMATLLTDFEGFWFNSARPQGIRYPLHTSRFTNAHARHRCPGYPAGCAVRPPTAVFEYYLDRDYIFCGCMSCRGLLRLASQKQNASDTKLESTLSASHITCVLNQDDFHVESSCMIGRARCLTRARVVD